MKLADRAPSHYAMPKVLEGRFELLEQLSSGEMAAVWRALDRDLAQEVAIKQLLRHPDQSRKARFLDEARSLRRLSSPHVVRVYEVYSEGPEPFFVMPLLAGQPLSERIRLSRGLSWTRASPLLRQLCVGLAHAHQNGIIHRDLKPSNVWLQKPEEQVVLLDFGIAWTSIDRQAQTATGFAVGTPAYLAPEVLAGGKPSPAMDVYGVGLIAFQMLTGTLPARTDGTPPPRLDTLARSIEAGVDASIATVVERALDPDPAKRYADAGELLDALARAQTPGADALAPGMLIDERYEVGELQGEGGMAVVYRARDTRLGRDVALKVLNPPEGLSEADQAELRGRFRDEHEILMSMDHPHILPIYSVGHWRGLTYGVLQHIEGETLSKRLGTVSWPELLTLLKGIADALDAAHRQKVVHRDVKPSNILIRSDGHPVLIDFGVARLGGRWRTRTGYIIGTPGAEAPEQLASDDLDGSADQWAVAAILYRKLTGLRPGEDPELRRSPTTSTEAALRIMENVQAGEVAPLEPQPGKVSEAVAAAIHRGLSAEPANRFRSVSALIEALSSEPSPPRHRRVSLLIVAILAAALSAAFTVALWSPTGDVETPPTVIPVVPVAAAAPEDQAQPVDAGSMDPATRSVDTTVMQAAQRRARRTPPVAPMRSTPTTAPPATALPGSDEAWFEQEQRQMQHELDELQREADNLALDSRD